MALDTTEKMVIEPMPLEKLRDLESLGQQDPSAIFGLDMDRPQSELPPHAQSFGIIAMALQGEPVDFWGRLGVFHGNRRPEFKSFEAITKGLTPEEKLRFLVILMLYEQDMLRRAPDFREHEFSNETLHHARSWVGEMLDSVDPETQAEAEKLDNEDTAPALAPLVQKAQEWLSKFLKK